MTNKLNVNIDSDFLLEVLKGNVPGHHLEHVHGHSANIGTTVQDLWPSATKLVYLSSAEQMNIVSTSAADASAGTGARTVEVLGLDGNFVKQRETITMNGLTDVLTTKSFIRVEQILVLTVGSGLENAGDITATADSAGTLQEFMEISLNHSLSAHYTSPAGIWAVFAAYELNVGEGKDLILDVKAGDGLGALDTVHRNHVFESPFVSPIHDVIVPPKTDITFRVNLTQGSAAGVAASFNMLEVEENFVNVANV